MTGYLLDTNAISMFSPSKATATPGFSDWLEEKEQLSGVYLSAVTVHEIEKGVRLLEAKGAKAKAAGIELFLQGLIAGYSDRILPVDADVAREGGKLEARAIAAGHNPGASDAMIAGTASFHQLTVITSNLKHFRPFGIKVKSPAQVIP
ncbi:putative nucleic acid-binding protein [Sinorhizobium fredii]|uniref:PilT protein domain protein n=1 Tax=Sinorhizobium fredii (strain USDA 257) TaxID=1185652 RepID=I3X6F6_SINF2|nr:MULTISPECIES: type II toxin-antitoxin system VapC family toxin [Sinorhizobium]AFL51462.1 PilT protein domain protein [Sinorhizobium fredii USDA 257]PDT81752.1 PIN domain-containing protein [Sinorhizobium sp. BJ1]